MTREGNGVSMTQKDMLMIIKSYNGGIMLGYMSLKTEGNELDEMRN